MSIPKNAETVVLVIDVQTGLFRTTPPPWNAEEVLSRINEVTARARTRGKPVIFIRQDGSAEEDLAPRTKGWELDPRVHVEPGDIQLRKNTCDAFYETGLEAELLKRSITRLVVAGYATEFCLDSTVRSAASKGFHVVIVEDAHTTNDSPVLPARQIVSFHNWAWPNASCPRSMAVVKASEVDRVLLSNAWCQ